MRSQLWFCYYPVYNILGVWDITFNIFFLTFGFQQFVMSLSVVFILFIWLGWVQYLNDLNLWVVVFPQFVKISGKCFFSPIFSSNLDSHCTFVTLLDTVLQIIEASFFFPTCFSLDDFWSLPILSFVASDLLFMPSNKFLFLIIVFFSL